LLFQTQRFISFTPGSNNKPDIILGSSKNRVETVLVHNGRPYNPKIID